MIFCGSQGYPERGYLDRLATLGQSHGTNAYTAEDHTCYTFTSSSRQGLLTLLPVFLDHIFRPLLTAPGLAAREVFHRGPEGGQGVVYCEMASRQWSEQDQMDLALRRALLPTHGLPVYGWECGGLTQHISTLQVEEIVAYHRRFYRPDNAVVVLCGPPDLAARREEILGILDSTHFYPDGMEPPGEGNNIDVASLPPPPPVGPSVALPFPAQDESLGSVGLAWLGPPSHDMLTITALHILMRALKDTSASPLYQALVERAHPLASDIDYEIKPSYHTMISLVISGVPTCSEEGCSPSITSYLEEGQVREMVLAVVRSWASQSTEAIGERLGTVIKSLRLKLQESLEDDPHEIIASYLMPEIVRAHWPDHQTTDEGAGEATTAAMSLHPRGYGGSLTMLPHMVERLAQEPIAYWLDLLNKYLLQGTPVEVRMHPSETMNEQIKEWERNFLAGLPIMEYDASTLTPAPTDGGGTGKMDAGPDSNSRVLPLPRFALEAPRRIECHIQCDAIQRDVHIRIPRTNVSRLTMVFDVQKSLDARLWPALVLFQELLFQTDILIGDDPLVAHILGVVVGDRQQKVRLPYQVLVERLSEQFSTFEAALGFDNELFSTGYLDTHLTISLQGRGAWTGEQLSLLVRSLLQGMHLEADRLGEIVDNLNSQLRDSWRDPAAVLDTLLVERLETAGNRLTPERAIGLAEQARFLRQAQQMLRRGQADTLLALLDDIRHRLLVVPPISIYGMVTGEGEGEEKGGAPVRAVREREEMVLASVAPSAPLPPLYPYALPKHGFLATDGAVRLPSLVELIPMDEITGSYLSIVIPINVLPTTTSVMGGTTGSPMSMAGPLIDQFLSLALLCHLVSYTEGPLYRRIRGAGLAYGATLSMSLWAGLLSWDVNDATDPVRSLELVRALIGEILDEANRILRPSPSGRGGGGDPVHPPYQHLTEETIRMAQSGHLYQWVAERSTPAAIYSTALRGQLRGLPAVGSPEESLWNERLLQLTVREVALTAQELLPAFLQPDRHLSLLAVPSNQAKVIERQLTAASLPHRRNEQARKTQLRR